MRHPVARCLLTLAILFSTGNACFPYTIKGVIKNAAGCYYPRVSLEIINNIDGIYTTSSENLITSTNIDSLGNFIIMGNELPNDRDNKSITETPRTNARRSHYR